MNAAPPEIEIPDVEYHESPENLAYLEREVREEAAIREEAYKLANNLEAAVGLDPVEGLIKLQREVAQWVKTIPESVRAVLNRTYTH